VEVGRRSGGVAGGADSAQDLALLHPVAILRRVVFVEVSVVVAVAARAEDGEGLAAQAVPAAVENDAVGGAQHLRAARREDVDPLVPAPFAARAAPGVHQGAGLDPFDRHRQRRLR